MSLNPIIRRERPDDHAAIGDVINSAFLGKPYAGGDEAELVEKLRRDNALSVSLVAELEGSVIGQVVISPARASDGTQGWFGLGPIAVLPAHQKIGIGSQLVRAGLQAIAELGAIGCILVGDPGYYRRFGFVNSPDNALAGEPAKLFMIKLLGQHQPTGPISFHPGFSSAP